jgi:dTDP-4-dehydrorhamnose 3,5-epimerase
MLDVAKTMIEGVLVLTPKRFADERGFFVESYNHARFVAAGVNFNFVQDNHSLSRDKGTVRGLHYQAPPFAQTKLVRVLQGAILDVVVDARKNSPTYGQHVSVELSAENGRQLLAPAGMLHGFVTLRPDTEVAYKVDAYYDKASDGAVLWCDPDLAIDWGPAAGTVVSSKDANAARWRDFNSPF